MSRPNIIQGATGRNGAAYYAGAAQIVADSAARESQILASQSALALSAMENLGTSLSNGLSKYLDYKLAVKQQAFDRDMKLKEFQLREGELDLKRLEVEDIHLQRQQEAQERDLDLAQKQQNFLMAPKVRKARAEAAALLSAARGAAANIESENYTDEDLQTIVGVHKQLGEISRNMAAAGVPQPEIEQLQTQLIPLTQKASSVKFANGDSVSRAALRRSSLMPNTAAGQRAFIERPFNSGLADPEADENHAWVTTAVQNRKYADAPTAEAAFKLFLDDQGIPSDPKDPRYARARTLINSVRMMDPESRARLRVESALRDDPDRKSQVMQYTQANPGATWTSVEARFFPQESTGAAGGSARGWKPAAPDPTIRDLFVRKTLRGDRELTPQAAAAAAINDYSLWDLSSDEIAQLASGDYSMFDTRSMPDMLQGAGAAQAGAGSAAIAAGGTAASLSGAAAAPLVFAGAERGGKALLGRLNAWYRAPSADVAQTRAAETLQTYLAWAASASSPSEAHSIVKRATAYASEYERQHTAAFGTAPNMFYVPDGAEGISRKLLQQFRTSGYTAAATELQDFLKARSAPGSALQTFSIQPSPGTAYGAQPAAAPTAAPLTGGGGVAPLLGAPTK